MKIKRKSFILLSGASILGVYSLLKSPFEIFRGKVEAAGSTQKPVSVKFKENPHSIKRQNNS